MSDDNSPRISLADAVKILKQCSCALVKDLGTNELELVQVSVVGPTGNPDNQFLHLNWPSLDEPGSYTRFHEEDNTLVPISGDTMFLIDREGDTVSITPLFKRSLSELAASNDIEEVVTIWASRLEKHSIDSSDLIDLVDDVTSNDDMEEQLTFLIREYGIKDARNVIEQSLHENGYPGGRSTMTDIIRCAERIDSIPYSSDHVFQPDIHQLPSGVCVKCGEPYEAFSARTTGLLQRLGLTSTPFIYIPALQLEAPSAGEVLSALGVQSQETSALYATNARPTADLTTLRELCGEAAPWVRRAIGLFPTGTEHAQCLDLFVRLSAAAKGGKG